MASFNIHLAIGKIYEGKNIVKDINSFYNGIIAPDLAKDKIISHYTGTSDRSDLIKYLKTKVQLTEFLNKNNLDNDYIKGMFLHLITDYIFFNDFFDIEYIENITYKEFIKDLYYSYDQTNEYINKKYNIDMLGFGNKININIEKNKENHNMKDHIKLEEKNQKNILTKDKLDDFISRVANINLEKYKNKIVKYNKNILP